MWGGIVIWLWSGELEWIKYWQTKHFLFLFIFIVNATKGHLNTIPRNLLFFTSWRTVGMNCLNKCGYFLSFLGEYSSATNVFCQRLSLKILNGKVYFEGIWISRILHIWINAIVIIMKLIKIIIVFIKCTVENFYVKLYLTDCRWNPPIT